MSTVSRILKLHQSLQSLASLAPSEASNRLFEELVRCTACGHDHESSKLLEEEAIKDIMPSLQMLCARGEYELEMYWAKKIITSRDPWKTLREFPYFDNYLQLVHLDYQATKMPRIRHFERALFIGSGPLPLSAIFLAKEYGMQIDTLDNNPDAVTISRDLIRKLGLQEQVCIRQGNALEFKEGHQYNLIFLAALVGIETSEKAAILDILQKEMSEQSLLIARTAHGLRTLLYPAIPLELFRGFSLCATITPHNNIVNSVIIAQKE